MGAALASLLAGTAAGDAPMILRLKPLGAGVERADLDFMGAAIEAIHGLDVAVEPAEELPRTAWHAPRSRYRAEKLIDHLDEGVTRGAQPLVLGVTCCDISTTTRAAADWGIIGLAQRGGTAGVVSSFRCGRGADLELRRIRLAKVAVHEVGHIRGLPHCTTPGCLMADAHGSIATVDRGHDFCGRCRGRLAASGALPGRPVLPWP